MLWGTKKKLISGYLTVLKSITSLWKVIQKQPKYMKKITNYKKPCYLLNEGYKNIDEKEKKSYELYFHLVRAQYLYQLSQR